MKGYVANIQQHTLGNTDFRRVVYTANHLQLVLMTLQPGEDIGAETHAHVDQFFRVEKGSGTITIDGTTSPITEDTAMLVPAGATHNVSNTGQEPLQLYTLYGPPNHNDSTVQATKTNAKKQESEHFNGMTTEVR